MGAALLGAGTSAFAGFVVTSAIIADMSPENAGILSAVASGAAIVARLVSGWAAGRRPGGHMLRVAALLMLGALSCVAVGMAQSSVVFIVSVVAVSATAWSSNALYLYAVVNKQPHAPGKATSTVQLGAFAGSAVGPFLFGFALDHANGRAAWLLLAVMLLIASGVVLLVRQTFGIRTAASPSR